MRKRIWIKLLLFLVAFFPLISFSQVVQQWVQSYSSPGNNNDIPGAMTVDRLGNVYVTGTIDEVFPGDFTVTAAGDYVTVKYNASGALQWIDTYNGPANGWDYTTAIAVDFSGNVYVTGASDGGATSADMTTIKYNSLGVQQWVARYDGSLNLPDEGDAIVVDGSGNVYVTGYSIISPFIYNLVLIKYNSAGVQQWVQTYNPSPTINWGKSIGLDLLGNVYVSGWCIAPAPTNTSTAASDAVTAPAIVITPPTSIPTRGIVLKYSAAGTLLWVREPQAELNAMTIDVLGNVYVTGGKTETTGDDYSTIKYNTSGVEQWEGVFNGYGNGADDPTAITTDLLGNVYVTGSSYGGGLSYDYATVKYNSAGVQQWVADYNDSNNLDDYATDLGVDLSGNVYVTGRSETVNIGNFDYVTIRYNSSGIQQWLAKYDGPSQTDVYILGQPVGLGLKGPGGLFSNILAINPDIYIAGVIQNPGTGQDFVTVKYSQPLTFLSIFQASPDPASSLGTTLLSEQSELLSGSYRLTNFPNPCSTSTKITYYLPADSRISIKVFDLLGREVATLVDGERTSGVYNTDFYVGSLQNGVYFCKFIAESSNAPFEQTKKIVVVH
jgi:hypothetical protein